MKLITALSPELIFSIIAFILFLLSLRRYLSNNALYILFSIGSASLPIILILIEHWLVRNPHYASFGRGIAYFMLLFLPTGAAVVVRDLVKTRHFHWLTSLFILVMIALFFLVGIMIRNISGVRLIG